MPVAPFTVGEYTPYAPTKALQFGQVLEAVTPQIDENGVIQFTVAGADPWLGTPEATLLDGAGQPVLFDNGEEVKSHTLAWWVEVNPSPSYKDEPDATERQFAWTWSLPVRRAVAGVAPNLSGQYQVKVTLPSESGMQTVFSEVFDVGE